MLVRIGLLVSLALALPERAAACTTFNFNIYEGFYEPSIVRLSREAATIDWVEIKTTGPQRCARFPDPMWEPDGYQAPMEDPERDAFQVMQCSSSGFAEPGLFVASVVERLKGQSAGTFDLYQGAFDGSDTRFGFSDLRELSVGAAYVFDRHQRVEADARHASLAYWYRAVVDMPLDGTNSCGGSPAFTPYIRYIVFRDQRGAVMAYAPVRHQDDVLLIRLRNLRDDPNADIRTVMRVEDYFRRTSDLVLGRIVRCSFEDDGWDRKTQRVIRSGVVTVERGEAAFLNDGNSDIYAPLEKNEASFNYLSYHFKYRGESCPNGAHVLIAGLDMSEASAKRSTWSLSDNFVRFAARILDPEYGDNYLSDWAAWSLEQPIRVSEGNRVKLSDMQTGLKLVGPNSVSVDDIFRWHEEGRAARARR